MKREAGFSLIELLVATALMLVIVGTLMKTLSDATYANEGVTLLANSQENLRAAMNYMVKDIIEAGEGLPQGGITIPNAATVLNPTPAIASVINRPGPVGGPATFPPSYITLPAITDGFGQGPLAVTPNPAVPADSARQSNRFHNPGLCRHFDLRRGEQYARFESGVPGADRRPSSQSRLRRKDCGGWQLGDLRPSLHHAAYGQHADQSRRFDHVYQRQRYDLADGVFRRRPSSELRQERPV